jgi:hypothetical protein
MNIKIKCSICGYFDCWTDFDSEVSFISYHIAALISSSQLCEDLKEKINNPIKLMNFIQSSHFKQKVKYDGNITNNHYRKPMIYSRHIGHLLLLFLQSLRHFLWMVCLQPNFVVAADDSSRKQIQKTYSLKLTTDT